MKILSSLVVFFATFLIISSMLYVVSLAASTDSNLNFLYKIFAFSAPGQALAQSLPLVPGSAESAEAENLYTSFSPSVYVSIARPLDQAQVYGPTAIRAVVGGRKTVHAELYIDGNQAGERISARGPFVAVWQIDFSKYQEGSRTVTVKAFDNFGSAKESQITVQVILPGNPPDAKDNNLILNAGLENGQESPLNWKKGSWGDNDVIFEYPSQGKSEKGAGVTISKYNSGDAKWYFEDVSVEPGKQYVFSDFYKSTCPTAVTARFSLADGTFVYKDLGYPQASDQWQKASFEFSVPPGAVSMTVFHLINREGSLYADDFYLGQPAGQENNVPFEMGMVSLNFDDGWESIYKNAIPILDRAGLKSTQYIFTQAIGQTKDGYMPKKHLLEIAKAGHEIGSHSLSHADLTTLGRDQALGEINNSRDGLLSMGIKDVKSFAYPYGAWNQEIEQLVSQAGYSSARTAGNYPADFGSNYKNNSPYLLKTQVITSGTSIKTIKSWIDEATKNKTWLILVFHQIDKSGQEYSTSPSNLSAIVDYLKTKNIKVVTNSQGAEMLAR